MTRQKKNSNKADERGTAGDGDRDHQQHENSDSDPDLTATLLRLVKVTEVLTANSNLQSEIKELRDCNRNLPQRIETLEDKSSEWANNGQAVAMSEVSALVSSVADEMQTRRNKKL